jgi:hypothetical protein
MSQVVYPALLPLRPGSNSQTNSPLAMYIWPSINTYSHRRRWYFLVPLNRFLDRWTPGRFLGGFLMGPDKSSHKTHVIPRVTSGVFIRLSIHALCSCFNHAQAQRCVLVGNLVVRRSQFWKGEVFISSVDTYVASKYMQMFHFYALTPLFTPPETPQSYYI